MYFLNVLLTLCTHIERSSKFPSVSDSWCMRESQQYVSTYAACFIVKLLGGKAANLWAWEEKQRKWRHKWQYSSITWCCISAESGWHVCNSTRSFSRDAEGETTKASRKHPSVESFAAWARGCDPAAERRPSTTLYRPLKHLFHPPKPTVSLQFTDWTQHAPTHGYNG